MSIENTPDPHPLGIPLQDLMDVIQASAESRQVERVGNSVVVTHEHFVTAIDVVPYEGPPPTDGQIQAVIQVRSMLPADMASVFSENAPLALANRMATLGALTTAGEDCFVGSRLTVYAGDNAWERQAGLVLCAAEIGADSMFGAVSRTVTGEGNSTSPSAWEAKDFEEARKYLLQICLCEADPDGLTAEFGLQEGALSSVAGHPTTALWQMEATSHPDVGGGLFGVLTMPHLIRDEAALDAVAAELNRLEMRPVDAPPHFGAWTRGAIPHTVAYCMFFPNLLHPIDALALSASMWSAVRSRWANAVLSSMGYSAE